jgi:hypothetical protein
VGCSNVEGLVADCVCPQINFYAGPDGLTGDVLGQEAAVGLADLCFGALLEA